MRVANGWNRTWCRLRARGGGWRRALFGLIATAAYVFPSVARPQDSTSLRFADALRQLTRQGPVRPSSRGAEAEWELVAEVYAAAPRPLWSVDGRPTTRARRVLDALGTTGVHGLRSPDEEIGALRQLGSILPQSPDPALAAASFDVGLTRLLIHFLTDLHRGRVDPGSLGFTITHPDDSRELLRLVRDASGAEDVVATIALAAPRYAGYAALVRALARYRELAADTTLRLPSTRVPIRPDDAYADAPALRRLLIALGDLAPDAPWPRGTLGDSSGGRYVGALVPAIARFQQRHGLESDGIIGLATLAQLRVPLGRRVQQIELSLERWRWLPDQPPPRYLMVNIAAFELDVFENDPAADRPVLGMKVIGGQARRRYNTPMFSGEMREVVFRPYWEVPPRIAREELVPLIRRHPDYMEREGFEIVRREGEREDALPPTAENLSRVASGALRLRQRPGANNALGLVKFDFPNDYHIYLHGTPAQNLFARARRDFSHGCIRAEQPASLAALVLRGQPGWDSTTIDAAMRGRRTIHVPVARPVTVYVLYVTVVAREGTIDFYPDLYGRDAALAESLESLGRAHQ